jgi:phosphate transport system permease protein
MTTKAESMIAEKYQSTLGRRSEKIFSGTLLVTALVIIVLLLAIFLTLVIQSLPAVKTFGFGFFVGRVWNPVAHEFGALPFLIGTLLTSLLALIISVPFSLAISIFLGEYYEGGPIPTFLKSSIEVLAGIPSVIYGLWGIFILMPIVRVFQTQVGATPHGVGIFTASLILAIMIVPFSASIGREVVSLVPAELKEAAYSLGATRYEVIRKIILPYAWSGIIAGILLALGRALGETMAVTMLIGNSNYLPTSIFAPGNTMASLIANEFAEATEKVYLAALIEIGLVLFLVTTLVNMLGTYIIKKVSVVAEKEVT